MGEGGHESDSCRMGEVEGVGMVGKSGEPGRRMGYHGNIMLRTNGGREAETGSLILYGEGRGEAETESLILWLVVLELLAGG